MFLSLKSSLNGKRTTSVTPPPQKFYYIRPSGGFSYFRPDSTSKYIRP